MPKHKKKVTIDELEKLLAKDEDTLLEILPNGEIRAAKEGKKPKTVQKPLTMRENLGGEYAA